MLTTLYRPKTFAEVVGQDSVVSVLKSMVMHPEDSPRSIILYGPYGSGKSSLARIFVRAVNCLNKVNHDVCGMCENCAGELTFGQYYQEYDSTQVGNVEFIRNLRSDLQYTSPGEYYRVIVFDECQSITAQGMSALLRVLEDTPEKTFFVFTTTDVNKLISTIRSRSIELSFQLVPIDSIFARLKYIVEKEKIIINDDILYRIALYSGGHVRDAVMRLDLYNKTEDKKFFVEAVSSNERLIMDYLVAVKAADKEKCALLVSQFMKKPLASLFHDWEIVILNLLREFSGISVVGGFPYKEVVELYSTDVFKLLKILSSDWVERCFKEDLLYQGFLWFIYYEFSKTHKVATSGVGTFIKK